MHGYGAGYRAWAENSVLLGAHLCSFLGRAEQGVAWPSSGSSCPISHSQGGLSNERHGSHVLPCLNFISRLHTPHAPVSQSQGGLSEATRGDQLHAVWLPPLLHALHAPISQGGLSKATRGLHVSEDVMGGLNHMLRGADSKYSEAISCGKGRCEQGRLEAVGRGQ